MAVDSWYKVIISNLEVAEYWDLISLLSASSGLAICHESNQYDATVTVTHPDLQRIVNTVKFCSEVYDNPEYQVISQSK